MRSSNCRIAVVLVITLTSLARAADTEFVPDPSTVMREGPAYRYPQAGWIVIHVEGEPYERGFQQGKLLAPEIAGYIRCFAAMQSAKAPADAWKLTRRLVDAVFLRRFDVEYLEEMRGIADGAVAAGAKFDGRNLDLIDIVALNSWAELICLDWANRATPTGLEGLRFPRGNGVTALSKQPMRCSAFVATAPATAGGKIVFGHISMFELYPSLFFNIWLDIQPAKGHRIVMQTFPGGICSSMDWYMNDAGILVCETTIDQTSFESRGLAQASRIRKALQYSDSIDGVVEILGRDNNGLYTNEWLLADTKTNEIAMFELGTKSSKLYRSSKGEWFGNTEGFYWGCNNAKDLAVRMETVASMRDRPLDAVFAPSDRDMIWIRMYHQSKGTIDADFGKRALSSPWLAGFGSLDAKVTTSELAGKLKSYALFGPPIGRSWQPTDEERSKFPEITPLASNPWAIMSIAPPANDAAPLAIDRPAGTEPAISDASGDDDNDTPTTQPAWRGTILPENDSDAWLAIAFARYERFVEVEKSKQKPADQLSAEERDELSVKLFGARAEYLSACRVGGEVALSAIRLEVGRDEWHRIARGRGLLALHELRRQLGADRFDEMMDRFGTANAGKTVTTAKFIAHVTSAAGGMPDFFDAWIHHTQLPKLELAKADSRRSSVPMSGGYDVAGEVRISGAPMPAAIDVTVETEDEEITKSFPVESGRAVFRFAPGTAPIRLIVDKYNQTAKANGDAFSLDSLERELDHAIIVYGTTDDHATNQEAAERLQRGLAENWSNIVVPIRSDREASDEELKSHHVILIGRPQANSVAARFAGKLCVEFGRNSFIARGQTFGHPGSAILFASDNPLNERYAMVVLAGNSAASTLRAASMPPHWGSEQAKLLINGGEERNLVLPSPKLVREFESDSSR